MSEATIGGNDRSWASLSVIDDSAECILHSYLEYSTGTHLPFPAFFLPFPAVLYLLAPDATAAVSAYRCPSSQSSIYTDNPVHRVQREPWHP